MKKVVHTQAESMLKSKKVHRYLRRAVALLSVVVMLFTINTLKKRANTLERIPMCGMEEHLHDESCFNELGELICLLPEHQHTDACFQQAPVHEESAEEFAEEMEVDLSTEDESEVESQEAMPVEELPVEEEPGFELSQPALLSDILQTMNLPVTLNDVIDVGQVVNTEADAGLVSVERQENGDALVSANAAFDAAELAIITETDILTVKLVAGAAAAEPVAEEPVVEEPAEEIPTETVEETVEATAEDGIVEEIAPVAEEPTEVAEIETENVEEQTEVENIETVTEAVEVQLGGEEDAIEPAEAQADIEAEPEAVETAETEPEVVETVETAETEPEVVETVETAETEPEVEETVETAETEPEATVEAETEDEYVETVETEPETEAQSETVEPTEAEPETTETEPEEEAEAEPEEEAKVETEEETKEETEAEAEEETEEETKEETEEETKEETEEETKEEAEEEAEAETEEGAEEETAAEPETVEQSANASISVDLSSVDLMQAATVEGDTVTLAVSDLLNAEDDAVNLEGDLHVEAEEFAAAATVTDSDVEVQDGVITLTAEALESGTVSLELQTETTEDDVTTVTTQTVDITLTGYTGRTSDAIASDEGVEVVPLGDNTLPNDAYATIAEAEEVPEHIEIAPVTETTAEAAKAFDIAVVNDNQDKIAQTGEVEVTVTPENLNVYSEVPEGATADSESLKLELYHVHDDGTVELVPDVSFETDEEGNVTSFTFTTESFSTYVVKYTVDFTYVDVDGNEHFWQFPGTGSYSLREVLSRLGIEGETITDASLELTEAVGETSEGALYLTRDEETGEYSINSDVAFDDTYTLTVTLDNTRYVVTVTDDMDANALTYTFDVEFRDESGNVVSNPNLPYTSDIYVYARFTVGGSYFFYSKDTSNAKLDKTKGSQTVSIQSWSGDGNNLRNAGGMAAGYTSQIYLVVAGNSGQNFFDQNDGGKFTDSTATYIGDGGILGGYTVSIMPTPNQNHAEIVLTKAPAMGYTIKVLNADGTEKQENPDLNGKDWFIQATVSRADGSYIATERVSDKFANGVATGSLNAFYRKNGSNVAVAAYEAGEDVSFALLRGKDGGDHDWSYFYDASHINTNALSGSSVESKYTLHVDKATHTLTLQETLPASVTVTAHSGRETTSSEAAATLERTTEGKYYFGGEMYVQNGTVGYDAYALTEYNPSNATQTATIDNGLVAYTDENKWQAQFLTGKHSIEPVMVYVPVANQTEQQVLEAIKNGTATVYRDGDTVEGYQLVMEQEAVQGADADTRTAKLHLVKLPTFTVTGAWEGDPDTANKYYTLTEIKRGALTAYALTPISAEATVPVFKDASGNRVYFQEGDEITNYVVKSATEVTLQQAIDQSNGKRYAAGQLAGSYIPSFAVVGDSVTTTLKQVSTTGTAQTVSVQLYDRDMYKISAADPQLSAGNYVLAFLTAKGDPNRQVVGWIAVQVNDGKLNGQGVDSFIIPDSTGFKAVDSDLNVTGDTLGYDADLYDLNLRLYHYAGYNINGFNFSTLDFNGIRSSAELSDSAHTGYDFVTPVIGATESEIRLRQAYSKEYRLRVDMDEAGLKITEADQYIVRVKLNHYNGDPNYAFAKLVVDENDESTYLEFYGDNSGNFWRDMNCTIKPEINITGNEKSTQLEVIRLAKPFEQSTIGNLKNDPLSANDGSVVPAGQSINMYTLSFGERETADEHNGDTYKTIITDIIKFSVDDGDISKGEIDSYLETATDFGLYTENLSVHGTDMESNIGAARLSGQIGADYGFSNNNIQINRVKVVKKYEGAATGTPVTLKLYPVESVNGDGTYNLGEGKSMTVNTDADGIAVFEYDRLPSGTYVIKEVIGGHEYWYGDGENGVVRVNDNLTIDFNEENLLVKNINVNVNYFGTIDGDVDTTAVIRHSRHGVIVTDDAGSYSRLITANGGVQEGTLGSVYMTGSEQHPTKYDIPADMENLRTLSERLGNTGSSRTVRIIDKKLSELNGQECLNLSDDGRFIVVNVDVTGAGNHIKFNPMTKINGVTLLPDFGQAGSEYASRVLYNFITRDAHGNAHPYAGHVDTSKEGAGVLLAPSAVVGDLAGNWGGTIICHEAQHTGSEIHSDSANKTQNINTVLTNRPSDRQYGSLELHKDILGESADRTTWFTFEVTLKKADGSPAANESFVASGLKDKNATSVTFDADGKARVQVRAQNKVLITGIPTGYTYTVKELRTPETAHYQLVHIVDAAGEIQADETATYGTTAKGAITKDTTDVVEVVNAHKVGGLTVGKAVVGDATKARKFHFQVTLLNEDGEVDTSVNRYYGGMHFVSGVAEFELGNGEFRTAKSIPEGTKFKVEELDANSNGFDTSVNLMVNVAEGTDNPCTVEGSVVTGEIIVDEDGERIAIVASYTNTHTEGCNYTPKVTKIIEQDGVELETRRWPVKAQSVGFTFDLAYDGEMPAEVKMPELVTVKATAMEQLKSFGAIRFEYVKDKNYPQTYTFTVTERVPEEADRIPGVTYCSEPLSLTVTVDEDTTTDPENPTLKVTEVLYGEDRTKAVTEDAAIDTAYGSIVNTYDSVKAQPKAYKKLDGQSYDGALTDGEGNPIEFTFQLTPVSVDGVAVENPTTVTATTDHTSGKPYEAAFAEMEFNKPGTYVYKITERDESSIHTNIVYDKAELFWKLVVGVKDGKLTINTDRYYTENTLTNLTTSLGGYQDGSQAVFENHELTNFHFIKIWTNGVNIEEAIAWPKNTSITVTMKRKHLSGDVDESFSRTCVARSDGDGNVAIDEEASGTAEWTLSGEESKNYRFDISKLEKYDDEGKAWVYYAQETGVPYGFHVKYGENNGEYACEQNDYKIYNHLNTVHLPATGGAGTNALYALGGGLVLLAALGWVLGSRKRRDDEA